MDYLRRWMIMSNVKDEGKKTVKKEEKKSVKTDVKKSSGSKTKSVVKKTVNKTVKKGTTKKYSKTDEKSINKPMNVEEITLEEADSYYHISLLVQAVCVIGVLFITILALFEHSFTVPIEVLVGVTLLVMAYNNIKLFKRKFFTVVYIVFGVISLLVGILGYFGVTL